MERKKIVRKTMKRVLHQPSASIERLLQHGRYLDYLSKRLLTYLPDEFSKKVSVLGFTTKGDKHILIVSVVSAAWASKLRFYLPALKRSLCTEAQFSHIQSIRLRVTSIDVDKNPKINNVIYSNRSAEIIETSAQHINDKDLKAALIRLSQHVNNDS